MGGLWSVGPELPVDTVSWENCQEFITRLQKRDKNPYRLPTEAEWEYACRAGTTTPFSFGDTISSDQANLDGTITYGNGKRGRLRNKTTPVGSFPCNAWGLYDMHGNLEEWCQDWFGEYSQTNVIDPQWPNVGNYRVLRGGSWLVGPVICRSAHRHSELPTLCSFFCGMRLCFCPESK
jgi:sulfatase modifying factor 1